MSEFINELSTKYHLPQDQMCLLVNDVMKRIEIDPLMDNHRAIDLDVLETASMARMYRIPVYQVS